MSPINTGSTVYNPPQRGRSTLTSIAGFPFDQYRKRGKTKAIADVTVDYSTNEVVDLVTGVWQAYRDEWVLLQVCRIARSSAWDQWFAAVPARVVGVPWNQMSVSVRQIHMSQTSTPAPANPLRVIVVELDDAVSRRKDELPNLYVGLTIQRPKARAKQLQGGVDRVRWVTGHVVRLRDDLMVDVAFDSQDSARAAKKITQKLLQAQGYTVNRGKSMWSTYVVQLDEGAIDDPGSGWVYVGETSLSPEDRLAQHLSGARNRRGRLYSKVVRDHGQHLRYDVMEGLPVQFSSEASKRAEAELAEHLRENGYRVEGGH